MGTLMMALPQDSHVETAFSCNSCRFRARTRLLSSLTVHMYLLHRWIAMSEDKQVSDQASDRRGRCGLKLVGTLPSFVSLPHRNTRAVDHDARVVATHVLCGASLQGHCSTGRWFADDECSAVVPPLLCFLSVFVKFLSGLWRLLRRPSSWSKCARSAPCTGTHAIGPGLHVLL